MNFNNLFTDDDAVSPVIGVILMVAITVILAAVIGTFVLGLGDQISNTSPSASFTFDFEDGSSSESLTITHDGGDSIKAGQLTIQSQTADWTTADDSTVNSSKTWQVAADVGANDDVSAGSSVTITDASSPELNEDTVRITWEASGGGDTATLGKWTGPNA